MSQSERSAHPVSTGEGPQAGAESRFPCGQCGADLVFEPGSSQLVCGYCGFDNEIETEPTIIEELDFRAHLAAMAEGETEEVALVKCQACAAQIERPEHLDAFDCVFCGISIVAQATSARLIKPQSLLPFHVPKDDAHQAFRRWIESRWFAPTKLKRFARSGGRLQGVYLPYWTFDSATVTAYTGQRGEHYWVTESYTTVENGKTVRRTRQVQKTRWYSARGTVHNRFDDLLVIASRSLPRKYVEKLEPWDLANLVPYKDDYVAGFSAEKYQVDLEGGFDEARQLMDGPIRMSIRRDIGGDVQRISSMKTEYDGITFKHMLLPAWISAYRFRDKVYRILVNARTGEVQGERPWSVWKIVFVVLGGLAAAGSAAGLFVLIQSA